MSVYFGTEGINPIYYYLHAHIPKAMNQSWQLLTACSFNTRHTYKSCTVFLYLSALYFRTDCMELVRNRNDTVILPPVS